MFVPVACTQCGKPFQVPEGAVGGSTACPWCHATVVALPVGAAVAVEARPATAAPSPPPPQLLSLDDEPAASATPRAVGRRLRWWLAAVAGAFALLLAAVVTIALLRYQQGHITGMEWRTFTAADGSCAVDLLGAASEDSSTPSGERRYVSTGWYSGTTAWVGWRDLTQREIQLADTKDAWHQLASVFETERDRLRRKYGGDIARSATIQFDNPLTHEIRLTTPNGTVAERIVVVHRGARPRVYFVGMAGRFDPDGEDAKRLFASFRTLE